MRTYTPSVVELVDDLAPTMTIDAPEQDEGFSNDTIVARGEYDEKGSGMDMIEYSLDNASFLPLTSWSDGGWNLPITFLTDGEHTLAVRGIDSVGNKGDQVSVSFVVDTIPPNLDVHHYPHLVNVTSLMVTGRTEALATLTLNGQGVNLDENGNFSVELVLTEGINNFDLAVTDRAGNHNGTKLTVVSDTILPDLEVTAPEDDIWTNARWVHVEGMAEIGSDLRVNGVAVELVNGTFKKRVDLVESDFVITVTSTDTAGNTAQKVRVLHVDWTAPELVIVEPVAAEVYVRESSLYISGDVDDPTIDHVLVNDEAVPLTSGRFVKQFTVLEGHTEFVITVVDAAMNGASAKVVVIRDLPPPSYQSNMPALGGDLLYVDGDHYCTAPTVEVYLTLNEVSVMTLGDGTEIATGTEVRYRFDLSEGVNVLDIYIKDTAGNQAQTFSERVNVDTTAPNIDVQSPQPGFRTKEDTVTIHGFTDALVDGRNEFKLDVEDAMGNSNSASISVLRESDVSTGETSSTGSTVTGFAIGLVVGIVLMAAFMYVRGRGAGPDEEPPTGPRPPEPREPFRAPQAPQEGAGRSDDGGWEEY
jgi:hypothetical protein